MDEIQTIMSAIGNKRNRVIFEFVELSSTKEDAEALIKFLDDLPTGTIYNLLLLMKERWPKVLRKLANNKLLVFRGSDFGIKRN